ncbi:MAG: putative ABC transporter permease [Eubacterium sp.]|nr:putative ABC transporter permease [Eubacterium sp.]
MGSIRQRISEFKKVRYDWMIMIILCSLLGFIVENIWNYFTNGYVDNRNMFLPFLIGYGIAILLVYVFFGVPSTSGLPMYCLKVCVFTTAAEIALGYVVEWICGFRYWDYSSLPLHFTPYASIITALGFTVIIALFMNVHFTPLMELFSRWAEKKAVRILAVVIFICISIDWAVSFVRMFMNRSGNETWLFDRDFYALVSTDDLVIVVAMFFVFSFLGWCMESAYISWMNKKWTNRGLMKSPLCPIYGFGEFFGYRLLLLLPHNYILIFVVGTVFATLLELLVAKIMIWKTGYLWWDYTNRPFNYKGILCLESTIAWGVIAVVVVGFLHNGVESLLRMIPSNVLAMITIGLIIYTIGDLIYSLRKFRQEGLQAEENNILKVK